MITKKRMLGDLIFDRECKVNSRVVYCDPDTEMITRTEDGVFIYTKVSSMSKDLFDKRFEIIHTLFDTETCSWKLPIYSNVEPFYNNASISMKMLAPTGKDPGCIARETIGWMGEILRWDSFSDGQSPIRNGNLYMKINHSDVKVVIPLSMIEDKSVEVYVNGKNILDYCCFNEKTVFSKGLILNDCWNDGVLNDGISMIPCEYKWYSKYQIAIRKHNEPEYNVWHLHVEDFIGKNPEYILWFNTK